MRSELILTPTLVKYVVQVKVTHSKTFQNQIFQNSDTSKKPFNSKKCIHIIITKLRKTRVAKKRNRAILREMTFANNCANCCFFAQNWCATKEKFCVPFRKNCAKVLRMETLYMAITSAMNRGINFNLNENQLNFSTFGSYMPTTYWTRQTGKVNLYNFAGITLLPRSTTLVCRFH